MSALEAQLAGSAAAGAPSVLTGTDGAPDGSPAFGLDADTATSTAQSDSELITSKPSSTSEATSTPEAANDNQPVADDENEPQVQEATTETASELEDPVAIPEPANDNPPPSKLPATGTE